MLESINITTDRSLPLAQFLQDQDYTVEQIDENVCQVSRDDDLPVFVQTNGQSLFFEVDLGNVSEYASQDLYFQLLNLNTEILPVSIGFDSTNPDDPRLVLVESREANNLDDNELLSVFNALEIATEKVAGVLSGYIG